MSSQSLGTMKIEQQIEHAVDLILHARHVTALTGAGSSTPSGIPDFRSSGSGLWEFVDPFEVATIYAFRHNPAGFYKWVRPFAKMLLNAEPNAAHFALAELEELGVLQAIVTQNIDGLHQRAGSKAVVEVHGHLRQATCMRCQTSVPGEPLIRAFVEHGAIPHCELCAGVMKPDIILFGEQLPVQAILAAQRAARESDLMIVAGSSLEVAPAGDLPWLTKQSGGKLVFVNLGPTPLDGIADVLIRADVKDGLPLLVRALRRAGNSGSGYAE